MTEDLAGVLRRARDLGYLGPGRVEAHIEHSLGFARAWEGPPPGRMCDLGTGGGVPGLLLAGTWLTTEVVLIEAAERRAAFCTWAVGALGFGDRVRVVRARAEVAGRDPALRASFDLVTARGFGPPAVTAECGAPLLRLGGRLIVSEPPEPDPGRWPAVGLARVGLAVEHRVRTPASYVVLVAREVCPAHYPRRVGVPAKRPLF